jgi:hypothetical protein
VPVAAAVQAHGEDQLDEHDQPWWARGLHFFYLNGVEISF